MTPSTASDILSHEVSRSLPRGSSFFAVEQMDIRREGVILFNCWDGKGKANNILVRSSKKKSGIISMASFELNASECILGLSSGNKAALVLRWGLKFERPVAAEMFGRVFDVGPLSILIIRFDLKRLEEGRLGPCDNGEG